MRLKILILVLLLFSSAAIHSQTHDLLGVFDFEKRVAVGTMTLGEDMVSDLSQDASGRGWTWTAKTATLTLAEGFNGNDGINIGCRTDDIIRINFTGNIFINGGSASALFCIGSLEIDGNGTLTLESYNEAVLATLNNLTVNSGTLVINAKNNGELAISSRRNMTIGGQANVVAKATEGVGGGLQAGASISVVDDANVNILAAGEFHGINAAEGLTIATQGTVSVSVTGSGIPLVADEGKISVAEGKLTLQKPGAKELSELTSGVVEQTGGIIDI